MDKNVKVKNYYNQIWKLAGSEIHENLYKTTFIDFFSKFIIWFKQLKINKNHYYTDQFIFKAENICKKYDKLIKNIRKRNNDHLQSVYRFRSLNDIKLFLTKTLQLSDDYEKMAWFMKGIFLAHKNFIKKKCYDQNVKRFKYYYTLLYHCWFCKGEIPARKCVLINGMWL